MVVSVTTDAPEFAPALARSHASDDVKTEILAITSASAPGAEADGWRYSKSGPRFSRLLCPCVTLHVEPGFTFIEKGLICLAQPLAWVQSDAFASALKQVFGQTGTGPALCSLRTLDRDRRLGELKRQFATPSVHFIDIDAPGFTPEKGYFQTEALPEYLASLRTTVAAIAAEDHSTTSEAAFLHGLPEACDPVTIATRFHCAPHGAASRIGWRGPLHCTAVGKVMLSQSGAPDSLDLTAQTARTITDRGRLAEALESVRRDGFAVDDEELLPGLRCVAVPWRDGAALLGAISVSGRTGDIPDPRKMATELSALVAGS